MRYGLPAHSLWDLATPVRTLAFILVSWEATGVSRPQHGPTLVLTGAPQLLQEQVVGPWGEGKEDGEPVWQFRTEMVVAEPRVGGSRVGDKDLASRLTQKVEPPGFPERLAVAA